MPPGLKVTQAVMSSSLDNIAYILGGLTATGGTIGFLRTRSVPSIVAGLTVGLLYGKIQDGLGGYRIQNREPYGVELALLASVVLGGSSIPRAIRLRKPVPIVLGIIASYGLYTFGTVFGKTL
ncbi:transmembrane protein 14C [Microdochium trichocladiopsis]|uniref:Transmembrane protein 14C n=1 Tax=Microdochium trichocladiopsis TaxID=1682393 RepID=A0A9P8YAY7_9PEZI|nr:transmembrane protein 14C [Microdochium trichocladiopsis]KAH7034942.1 transmembrane protein 14C [Microdochium trichocladiopsis]